jgi:hypothetical protein
MPIPRLNYARSAGIDEYRSPAEPNLAEIRYSAPIAIATPREPGRGAAVDG